MNITSIMTHNVVTVEMDDPIETVRAFFKNIAFHSILAVADRKLVGIIFDHDLFSEEWRDTNAPKKKAHEIMDKVPVTVDTKTSVEEAINLLALNNIPYLPVLSSEGVVEGVVTKKDVLKFYSKNGNCH